MPPRRPQPSTPCSCASASRRVRPTFAPRLRSASLMKTRVKTLAPPRDSPDQAASWSPSVTYSAGRHHPALHGEIVPHAPVRMPCGSRSLARLMRQSCPMSHIRCRRGPVELVRVGRQHLEVPIRDLRAVKVRRRRWDTHGRIREITVSPSAAPGVAPSTGVVSGRDRAGSRRLGDGWPIGCGRAAGLTTMFCAGEPGSTLDSLQVVTVGHVADALEWAGFGGRSRAKRDRVA
jgi:hypothetical protein